VNQPVRVAAITNPLERKSRNWHPAQQAQCHEWSREIAGFRLIGAWLPAEVFARGEISLPPRRSGDLVRTAAQKGSGPIGTFRPRPPSQYLLKASNPDRSMTNRLRTSPESFLPLTPVAFEILLALAEGARHG
jgi:hypothetical protein